MTICCGCPGDAWCISPGGSLWSYHSLGGQVVLVVPMGLVCHHNLLQEEFLFSGNRTIYASDQCHEMSQHQRLQEVSLYQFILMFMSISLTSKSILQSSTELALNWMYIYVYSGFVYFSLCCVFI